MYKEMIPTAEGCSSCALTGLELGRLNALLFFTGAKVGRLFINDPWLLQASPFCDPWVELLEKLNREDPGLES